jgi:UDP-N-acetylmuramoylalanine--D-glutamate ligase
MDLAGQRVTVMGLGRFGGGVGVARYLIKQGADVLVTDLHPRDELADSLAKLDGLPIEYRLGEHNVSDFTTRDLVVANPAVKPDNRFLRATQAAGIPITSEIRLLVQALPNRLRTIGVTGTAGKSTVTAMIGHILRKSLPQPPAPPGDQSTDATPRVWVGGNLGGSLLDHIDEIDNDDFVVLELSSFMLHSLREDKWSPHIAVVTNITPNHLDWHGSFVAYWRAKATIFEYQQAFESHPPHMPDRHDHIITTKSFAEQVFGEAPGRQWVVSSPFDGELFVAGNHNRWNAAIASITSSLAFADAGFVDGASNAPAALADFPGLAHRLQFVLEHNGVRYFNDSKCTTPEAAELAIKSFDPGTVHIILGGYDKGSDLAPLASYAAEHCAGVYTIGATGEVIATAVEAASTAEVMRCGELYVAVREVVKRARPGHVVLLSPACASWDQFVHYEQRGERFIELAKLLTG